MLKRILSIILCLSIFVYSVFMFIPFSVKANSIYNTIYDGFDYSSVISQHKTFSFTDKGGKKHTVFKATSSSAWICVFGERQVIGDDDELNYYLSWYSYTGYQSKLNVFFQFLAAQMGIITKGASTILEDAINNSSSIDVDYDGTNGLAISSDSVDKLREEIKKQYYKSIGVIVYKPSGTVKSFVGSSLFRKMYDNTEDYTSDYARVIDYKYAFVYGSSYSVSRVYFTNELSGYFVLDIGDAISVSDSNFYYTAYALCTYSDDNTLKKFNLGSFTDCFNYTYADDLNDKNNIGLYFSSSLYMLVFSPPNLSSHKYSNYDKAFVYYGDKPFYFFKSYEALYNYLHGDQNAYLSSKVEETGKDIKISIDDMNTNISDKMDELIDSINSKKDGMSADELQNAIDKGLESISGKMDDIKDNTEETNSKLDSLLYVMNEQNEILKQILGVTEYIAYNTTKEDGTNYTVADIKPHFKKCYNGVKNMLLYGTSSLDDDTSTFSVMVDNDVGIATYADDPENAVKDYHNGILGKFPFSVPYQLYEWLQVLQCEPKTPQFSYDYGFLLKYFNMGSDIDTIITFDLSQYDDWAKTARSFLKLSFVLAVAVCTYHKFKGEV